jgi:hypothetical protein
MCPHDGLAHWPHSLGDGKLCTGSPTSHPLDTTTQPTQEVTS